MIGEIGGDAEETAARWMKADMKKPVVGFIAGAGEAGGNGGLPNQGDAQSSGDGELLRSML